MKIKYLCLKSLFFSLFFINFIYSANFDLKKRGDIIKVMDIIKSAGQKTIFDEKINVLAFIIREIDFKTACPCVKKIFFKTLNDLIDSILALNSSDLHKLEAFLQALYNKDLISDSYKKQLNAIKWLLNGGTGAVPKFVKHQIIKKYKKVYGSDIFVEVGSCNPNLLISQCGKFKKTYAVGFEEATNRTTKEKLKKFKNIQLIPGEVEKKFSIFVTQLKSSAVLWLDFKNFKSLTCLLGTVFKNKTKSVILIDNASSFSTENLEDLIKFVNKVKPSAKVEVNYEIISII